MNVHIHTYVADNMVYVRLMLLSISYYEHSMSVSFTNDVICHVVCQINMSDLMMNIQTCATDNTTYTMLYFR